MAQMARSAAILAGVGRDSSLMQLMLGTSATIFASSGTGMSTPVEAGWSWSTIGRPGQPAATRA